MTYKIIEIDKVDAYYKYKDRDKLIGGTFELGDDAEWEKDGGFFYGDAGLVDGKLDFQGNRYYFAKIKVEQVQ